LIFNYLHTEQLGPAYVIAYALIVLGCTVIAYLIGKLWEKRKKRR
jgi:hypothetical protein